MFNKRTLVIEETIHVIFDEIMKNLKERRLEEEVNLLENELDELKSYSNLKFVHFGLETILIGSELDISRYTVS